MDVPNSFSNPDVPTPLEKGRVSEVRQRLFDRINVHGIVPAAVANGMLVVGMNVDPEKDCHFGLTYYLVVTGTLILGMVILNGINWEAIQFRNFELRFVLKYGLRSYFDSVTLLNLFLSPLTQV